MRRAILLGLCALSAAVDVAATEEQRVYTDLVLSEDSDGQHEQATYLGWRRTLALGSQLGLRAGYRHFSDDLRDEEFQALRLDYSVRPFAALDARLHVDQLLGDHWSPTLGGAMLAYRPDERWYWEASAERDLIDNAASASRELSLDSYVVSGDYRLATPLTLVLGGLYQDISDGNHRKGGLLRLVYEFRQLPGLSLQLRGRRVLSEFRGDSYFSPRRLDEVLAFAQLSQPFADESWILTASAGAGLQRVDDAADTPLFRLEGALRGWFGDHLGLNSKAGCANTGGPGNGSVEEDYRYCYGSVSLIWAW